MPVVVLAGDEDFTLYRKLSSMKATLLDEAWGAINYVRIEKPSLTDVIDNAGSVPFGPGNKVIVFDKCDMFTKKRGSKSDSSGSSAASSASKSAKHLELLESSLSSVAENTYLIFACPYNFDETLKLSKIVKNYATIERYPKTKFWVGSANPTLETWVRKEAKSMGATIDDEAISYLLDGTEADLRQISTELAKASTYIMPAKHITYDVVVELSPHHSHVFTLLEFWLAGKSRETMVSANELLSRQPAMQVMATLQTFLGRWIEMKAICDSANARLPANPGRREVPLNEQVRKVSADLKMKPFVVEKDLKRLRKHSTARLIEKRQQLTRLERDVKTGRVNERNALELFLST